MVFVVDLWKMNNIEEFNFINDLYDLYRNLFTDKQILIMDKYYKFNLSLSEISDELNISRSAVLDSINHCKEKLKDYESILKLNEKHKKIKEILENNDVDDEIKEKIYKEL